MYGLLLETLKIQELELQTTFPERSTKYTKTLSGFKIGKEGKTESLLQSEQAYYKQASLQRRARGDSTSRSLWLNHE